MSALLLPGQAPPQIDYKGFQYIAGGLVDQPNLLRRELDAMQEKQDTFALYLDQLGADLCDAAAEAWPDRTLKLGAAVAIAAYRESGFTQVIDTIAFEVAHFSAQMNGVPQTYSESLPDDPRLFTLTRLAVRPPAFDESDLHSDLRGGFEQVFAIGAGCSRHYLQQAVVSSES